MMGCMPYRISGRAVIAAFGGVPAMLALAQKHAVPLGPWQVRKWQARDSISADGLAAVLVLADVAKRKLDLRAAIVPAAGMSW
jgi:hypothetical protein